MVNEGDSMSRGFHDISVESSDTVFGDDEEVIVENNHRKRSWVKHGPSRIVRTEFIEYDMDKNWVNPPRTWPWGGNWEQMQYSCSRGVKDT